MSIAVLCGGVGAARYLTGLVEVVDPGRVTAIVNTGDDTRLHGLHVSPDLDTVIYTLAGAIDPDRGWGLAGETWAAMGALARYEAVRPDGSGAAPTWFNLGDRDLATHFYRTARLAEGADLTEVTAEIARAWQLGLTLLPMTDRPFATLIDTIDHGLVPFQVFFVRHRHAVAVRAVYFDHDGGPPSDAVAGALRDAEVVVIAPSNPLVSIGPIRALAGVDVTLAGRRDTVVAVSPIVGGAALKGPADRMMTELGHEPSVVGVARLYREVAATLVVDRVDAGLAGAVEREGMRCVVTDTVMSEPGVAATLASVTLRAASTT